MTVTDMSTTKYTMLAMATVLVLCFAGLGVVAASSDYSAAEEGATDTYTLSYVVGDKTLTVQASGNTTLATLDSLGVSCPEGQKFVGWLGADGATTYLAGSALTIAADTTLTASFKTLTYTVSVSYESEQRTVDYGAVIGEFPTKTVAPGEILNGYTINGSEKVYTQAEVEAYVVKENIVIAASMAVDWQCSFAVNGAIVSTCYYSQLVVPADPVQDNYAFVGWAVNGTVVDPTEYKPVAATVFNAVFHPNELTVTFTAGDRTVATETVLYGALAVEPKLPEGYSSWAFDFSAPVTADTTVEAVAEAPAPAQQSWIDNSTNQVILVLIVAILALFIAAFVYLVRTGKVHLHRGAKQ